MSKDVGCRLYFEPLVVPSVAILGREPVPCLDDARKIELHFESPSLKRKNPFFLEFTDETHSRLFISVHAK